MEKNVLQYVAGPDFEEPATPIPTYNIIIYIVCTYNALIIKRLLYIPIWFITSAATNYYVYSVKYYII